MDEISGLVCFFEDVTLARGLIDKVVVRSDGVVGKDSQRERDWKQMRLSMSMSIGRVGRGST